MQALLTRADLAKLLGVTPITIKRLVRAGKLPPGVRISHRVLRWPSSVIEQWMADLTG
jgi:predicted DNA-binding transcriptional regulator AlpA